MSAKRASPNANEAVMVRIAPDLMRKIDAARKQHDNPPSRPEVIRRILTDWFATSDGKSLPETD